MDEAALESVDFANNLAHSLMGFERPPDIIILGPIQVAIIHTAQMRPDTESDGR